MKSAELSHEAAQPGTRRALTDTALAHETRERRPQKLRRGARAVWLAGEVALAFVLYAFVTLGKRGQALAGTRARWMQLTSRRMLRVFGVRVSAAGDTPRAGQLVCNHLSYLDILVLASLAPVVFVAKADVSSWPVLGWLARLAGTVFVRRDHRSDVARVNMEMRAALDAGGLLVVFPEGTSSDGKTVLPFRSSLFEPAIHISAPIHAGCIEYRMLEGDPAEEVCYWRDMTLLPHLFNLLGRPSVDVRVAFAPVVGGDSDRKELARRAHAETLALHGELADIYNDSAPSNH